MNRFRKDSPPPKSHESKAPRPLREFVADEHVRQPSPLQRRINIVIPWLLPLVIFLLIISVGIWFAVYSSGQKGPSIKDVLAASSSSFSKEDIPELMEAYLQAIGGRAALQEIRSVRYEGRLLSPAGEYDFMGLLLMPDMGMLVTSTKGGGSLKLMLNGEVAWQVIEQADGSRNVVRLNETLKNSLSWSLRIHNSFRSLALKGPYANLDLQEMEFDGKPCYEVTQTLPDGTTLEAVLDKSTLYLLKTKETLRLGDSADEFTVIYDDHRKTSGIVEPHITRLYRNGVLDNEATVDSYSINPGLLSSLFDIPEEVSQ